MRDFLEHGGAEEFIEWQAFYRLEPQGSATDDQRFGVLCGEVRALTDLVYAFLAKKREVAPLRPPSFFFPDPWKAWQDWKAEEKKRKEDEAKPRGSFLLEKLKAMFSDEWRRDKGAG